jgi:hypothetical protein
MTDIRLSTEALDARSITAEDADVVQHSSLFEERSVKAQFGMRLCYPQTPICHLSAMR